MRQLRPTAVQAELRLEHEPTAIGGPARQRRQAAAAAAVRCILIRVTALVVHVIVVALRPPSVAVRAPQTHQLSERADELVREALGLRQRGLAARMHEEAEQDTANGGLALE